MAGAGRFRIGDSIAYEPAATPQDASAPDLEPRFVEALLGPALLLALAGRDVFCLHAAATLNADGGVVALAGDSGTGKSTLARQLASRHHWRRAADDVLPVARSGSGGVEARPHFPQLKLAEEANRQLASLPPQLPLRAVCRLRPVEPGSRARLHRLAPAVAMTTLLRHVHCGALLDDHLLARQLDFARHVADRVAVFDLDYPHAPQGVAEVAALLEALPR